MNWTNIDIGAFFDDPTADPIRTGGNALNDWNTYVDSVLNPGTKVTEIFRQFTSGSGSLQEQATASINAGAQFTIPPNQLGVVSFVSFLGGGGAGGLDLVRHSFILEVGAGTYGTGGTTIPADKIIELAPVAVGVIDAFRFQLGDIDTATIEDFVNGSGPYTIVGLSVFEATQNGDDKVWLFTGGNGTWGDGAQQTDADMFVDLTSQDPIPSPTVSYLPVKIITTTPYTITDDDLNRPLVFTSNNQVVNVPEAMPEASPQFLLFDFKAHFTGTGTHTINYPDSESDTFSQDALVYALCIDTSGDTVWIVKEYGGGGGGGAVDSVNGQTGVVVLNEEDIIGTAIEDDAVGGTYDLDLATFSDAFLGLTSNTTITFSNKPAVGESIVRTLRVFGDAGVTLAFPGAAKIEGEYEPEKNYQIVMKFSNYTTIGEIIYITITEEP